VLAGALEPSSGVVERGATLRLAYLSQDTAEIPGELRVLESLEAIKRRATLSDGRDITAGMLAERFGFRGDRGRTLVRDLSGGERRRLQLMRLLMGEPNVLLLDEPTNDLDIDTLTALEDLLDGWPGTLVAVSHDRYFIERVCDDVYGLLGDGGLRHLPGGVEQYLALRAPAPAEPPARALGAAAAGRHPRRAQGDPAARARAGARRGPRGVAARADGRGGDRPRPPARAAGRARRGRVRARVAGGRLARGGRDAGALSGVRPGRRAARPRAAGRAR
jgi:ATP-binding cassette subfamily F protein uup